MPFQRYTAWVQSPSRPSWSTTSRQDARGWAEEAVKVRSSGGWAYVTDHITGHIDSLRGSTGRWASEGGVS